MAAFDPFGSVPVPKKKRTNFNESFELSGTFPLSKVVPVCFIDTLPGSSWNINVYNLTKLETLIAPAMQRVNASLIWMKMPKRLVFRHFKKWYTGGYDGQDDHQKPHIHLTKVVKDLRLLFNDDEGYLKELSEMLFGPGTLWSYLGLPVPLEYDHETGIWNVIPMNNMANSIPENVDPNSDFVDLMPFIGYQYLFDTFFMDQSLSTSIFKDAEEGDFALNAHHVYKFSDNSTFGVCRSDDPINGSFDYKLEYSSNDLSEGGELSTADFIGLLSLFNRAWKKEYFTSALPTPQRGPEVMINMVREGDTAEVVIPEQVAQLNGGTGGLQFLFNGNVNANDSIQTSNNTRVNYLQVDSTGNARVQSVVGNVRGLDEDGNPRNIIGTAQLPNLSPIAITAFRNLFKLQSFLEKNNIGGGRFIETILAQWAERVPDFTVQRPQFVRATSLPVQISEVTATANTQGTSSVVGDQAGRARTQGNLGRVHIYTQEPSFIFGLYVVTAPPSYAGQGIPRFFQHINRFDEPWPDFQLIGEQAIKARELYYPWRQPNRLDEDFGYQQRYSEYKYMPDRVVGDFQTSLSFWHMARMFSSMPRLNEDFITQNLDPRIFAVKSERPVTASFFFEAKAKLKLSKFSTPKLA